MEFIRKFIAKATPLFTLLYRNFEYSAFKLLQWFILDMLIEYHSLRAGLVQSWIHLAQNCSLFFQGQNSTVIPDSYGVRHRLFPVYLFGRKDRNWILDCPLTLVPPYVTHSCFIEVIAIYMTLTIGASLHKCLD